MKIAIAVMVLLLAGCTSKPPSKANVIKTANVTWNREMKGEVIWVGKILPLPTFPGTWVGSYIAVIPQDSAYVAGNFGQRINLCQQIS